MTPEFYSHALEISLKNLGVKTIDIHYVHIPEISKADLNEEDFYSQIRTLFKWYEKMVDAGNIRYYGLALEMSVIEPEEIKWHIELEKMVEIANKIAAENNHFKFIQLPYNIKYNSASSNKNQIFNNQKDTIFNVADKLGLFIVGSMPFVMGEGFDNATAGDMLHYCIERPELLCVNCGSKNRMHIQEIIDIAHHKNN